MSMKALQGIKVVEMGDHVAAPFCARLLADLGAEVLKVEPPGHGDSSRRNGPFPQAGPDAEASGLFLFLNAGKRGVTLDASTPTGREMLLCLLARADVLVESSRPGLMEELKLDHSSVRDLLPRLVYTSVTPFGRTGPHRGHAARDLNVQAAGGISIGIGRPDKQPLSIPYSQADMMAGLAAAAATLIAVMARDETGRGQHVDVAGAQVLAVLVSFVYFLPNFIYRGVAGSRKGRRGGEAHFPNTIMPCKDGFVCLYPLQLPQYLRFMKLIGDPAWQEEPRYRNRRAMAEEYPDEAEALIAPWFLARTKAQIFQLCMEHKVPCAPVRTIAEVVEDPHLAAREFFLNICHPVAGNRVHPGSPFRLSRTPGRVAGPAPLLGQDNEEVYCGEMGLPPEELSRMRMAGVI